MSIPEHKKDEIEEKLVEVAAELEVPPSKYADAQTRYSAVGAWLNDDSSKLAQYAPEIYPQGSFALGTAIPPLGSGDYDVDAVCLLQLDETKLSQQELKAMVGERLREHGTYAKMLDPKDGGRRCWTLKYADASKFHLDILPAIPDEPGWLEALGVPSRWAEHAICITDRDSWLQDPRWPRSNPKGYVEWFKERKGVVFEERRQVMAKRIDASVEEIPDHEVRTPLQQVIQLLKRHRDIAYRDDDDRPISIIITTLAARAYQQQRSILDALLDIVPSMRRNIELRGGVWWVPNPVNPAENFADKWDESPRKRELFLEWLDTVERQHGEMLSASPDRLNDYLREAYDIRLAKPASADHGGRVDHGLTTKAKKPSRFDVRHREMPRWPLRLSSGVTLRGEFKRNGRWVPFRSGEGPLPKGCDLRFRANTEAPDSVEVYWQVVNTGGEAAARGQLRGQIFRAGSAGHGGLKQKEATAYIGMHWVECFIVQNGQCVGRSGEYVVNIA